MKKYMNIAVIAAIGMQLTATLPALSWDGEDEAFRANRDMRRADRQLMRSDLYRDEGRFGHAWRAERRARHDEREAMKHDARSFYHRWY